MDEFRDALLRLYRLTRMELKFYEALGDGHHFEVYGELMDIIRDLILEEPKDFEHTEAYKVLHLGDIKEDDAVRRLMDVYYRNVAKQPIPHIVDRVQMAEHVRNVGGYMAPEGDWT